MQADGVNNGKRNHYNASVTRTQKKNSGNYNIEETFKSFEKPLEKEDLPDFTEFQEVLEDSDIYDFTRLEEQSERIIFEASDISQNETQSDNTVKKIDPRPIYKAEIKRHIFNSPIEKTESKIVRNVQNNEEENVVSDEKTKKLEFPQDIRNINIIRNREEKSDLDFSDEDITIAKDYTSNANESSEKNSITEDEIERKLKKSRIEKAKEFVIKTEISASADIKSDEELQLGSIFGKNRRAAISHLKKEYKKALRKTAIMLAASVFLFIFSMFFGGENLGNTAPEFYIFVNFLVLMAALLFNSNEIRAGINSILKIKPNINAAFVFLWTGAIFHNIVAFNEADAVLSSIPLYSALALFVSVPIFASKCLSIQKTMKAVFSILPYEVLHTAAQISSEDKPHEIWPGIEGDEASICYDSKTKSFKDFLSVSLNSDPSVHMCSIFLPIGLLFSLFISIVTGIRLNDFMAATAAFSLSLCLLMPTASTLSLILALIVENEKLSSKKAAFLTYNGAKILNKSNAIIFDAVDIFNPDDCVIYGIKPFNNIPMDKAIVCAASVITKTDGPLAGQFAEIVKGCKDILLNVDSIEYEDRLGVSALIEDRHVLIGTAEHLHLHNVEVPQEDSYKKYCINGRKALFLAINNMPMAMFIVGYGIKTDMAGKLKFISENGITLIIQSTDPNINEEFVEEMLDLHKNTVKVINQKSGEYYKVFRNRVNDSLVINNFHSGRASSFLSLVISAFNVAVQEKTIFAVFATALATGILLLTSFAFSKSVLAFNTYYVMLFRLFWLGVSLFIPRLSGMLRKLFK